MHFTIFSGTERYHAGELNFRDDPLVSESARSASSARGEFGTVRPVRTEGVAQHVDFQVRLEPAQKF